jgi:muramoyltetrapeptide carboxypeptidase
MDMAPVSQTPRIKPPALLPGDTVGIVAPASNIQRETLEAGCRKLRDLGYKPFFFDSILDQDLYFAGSVERRARELEEMFVREEVRAILCARGGYGTNYLLGLLDLMKIERHPKIFCGYSDITTLLTYFADAAGFVTFHGPMLTTDFALQEQEEDSIDVASWQAALGGSSAWELELKAASDVKPLVEGSSEGILYGGCLSMLIESLGTPFEVQTAGSILFLEDVAERPYRIDRMLMQLKLAGKLADIRGIVFGEMVDCDPPPGKDYTLEDVIIRVVGDLGVPVAFGLPSGHVSGGNITLPIGVRAALQVSREGVSLKMLEAATLVAASAPTK